MLSGLVRVEAVRCGQHLTHFVGVGGSVGYISSVLGKELPGVVLVSAFAQVSGLQWRSEKCVRMCVFQH